MIEFKPNNAACILYQNIGYNRPPEIIETSIKKVGRKYITTNYMDKQFYKDNPQNGGLLENAEFGERGILYDSMENAIIAKKCIILRKNIRTYINHIEYLSYDELSAIIKLLKGETEVQNNAD